VSALIQQVADEIRGVTDAVFTADAQADEALRRFSRDITALGRRWRFLQSQRAELLEAIRDADARFVAWVEDRQRACQLRGDVPSAWIQAGVRAMLSAAAEAADTMGADEAGRLCGETLVNAFARR
jgi:hypothetical protein